METGLDGIVLIHKINFGQMGYESCNHVRERENLIQV